MKVLVMGAGAIGAFVGAYLARTGEEVVFCARGAMLQGLRERGLTIGGIREEFTLFPVTATDEPRNHAPYDLILFCVKSYDTESAARRLIGCLKPDGAVITLQNGIENEHRLGEILGAGTVLAGNSRIGAEVIAPGVVHHSSTGFVDIGELDSRDSERVRRFAAVFARAGILGAVVENFLQARWEKLLGNCGFNLVTTLTRRPLGPLVDDPDTARLMRTLMSEALSVAHAEGARVKPDFIDKSLNHARERLRKNRPSTLQDLERGKRLEYEAISGAVIRAARRHGISVPVTEAIYALLKMLDPGLEQATQPDPNGGDFPARGAAR
jgi:2-dehydropantoate 2-reductase